jgi:hypothetical protein
VHAQLDRHLVLLVVSCWADLLRGRFSSVRPALIPLQRPAHFARWIDGGVGVLILKSTKPVRMGENLDVFDIVLTPG